MPTSEKKTIEAVLREIEARKNDYAKEKKRHASATSKLHRIPGTKEEYFTGASMRDRCEAVEMELDALLGDLRKWDTYEGAEVTDPIITQFQQLERYAQETFPIEWKALMEKGATSTAEIVVSILEAQRKALEGDKDAKGRYAKKQDTGDKDR